MNLQLVRPLRSVISATCLAGLFLPLGCNSPEKENPTIHVPPRERVNEPVVRREPAYQRELAPCEADFLAARECFDSAYRGVGRPRITFLANTASSVAADTRPPPTVTESEPKGISSNVDMKHSPNAVVVIPGQGTTESGSKGDSLTATSDATGLPAAERMAVPVDRAAIEDQFADVFATLTPALQIIHLGIAREQLEREVRTVGIGREETFLQTMRDRNLADIAVLFDVRILRHGTPSRHESSAKAQVDAHGRTISASAEGSAQTTPIMTVAMTARAVRINDGFIIATVTPPRREVEGEVALGEAIRETSECGAAALASRMCARLSEPGARTTMATIRVLQAPNNEYVLEFMRWIEAEFPGSRGVFRSFSGGQGEFTVELAGSTGELIQKAAKQSRVPGLTLDAARSSENTITFLVTKN